MNSIFKKYIESLEPSFQRLMGMEPVTVATLPREMPAKGVYLFSHIDDHLYVGRTNNMRNRLQSHCRPKSNHNSASFAFRLAREDTGMIQATYTTKGSRRELAENEIFSKVFEKQKERVRSMNVRFVFESEPMKQALLEMYVSVSLCTPHNDFDNH